MPVDDELVELLIMAETAAALQLATGCADAMGEAILRTARDMVDVSSVLGRRQSLLIRTTRRDFEAAVDVLIPMFLELQAIPGLRIEMEAKHHADLALRPITRHLADMV